MPRNNGNYEPPAGQPVVTGTSISSTVFNAFVADIGNEMTNSIPRDGTAPPTADLPMGNFKLTGVADGSASDDAATVSQVADKNATNTPFTPAGDIEATDVQAAIEELDTEKLNIADATEKASEAEMIAGTDDDKFATALGVEATINANKTVIQRIRDTNNTPDTTTSVIPVDNSIPQKSEGIEILSVTITPTSDTNELDITVLLPMIDAVSGSAVNVTLFRNGSNDAIAAASHIMAGGGITAQLALDKTIVTGTTSPITITVNWGVGAGTGLINRSLATTATFGGVVEAALSVKELTA